MAVDWKSKSGLFAAVSLWLALPAQTQDQTIRGKITPELVSEFTYEEGTDLDVMSVGGHNDASLELGKIIRAGSGRLLLSGFCFSACAEYILTSKKEVEVSENTLIAFHYNVQIMDDVFRTKLPSSMRSCMLERALAAQEYIKEGGLNSDFWKIQAQMIEYHSFEIIGDDVCGPVNMSFKNKFWLPTSDQLRHNLGVSFDGHICADSLACVEQFVSFLANPGNQLAIGQTVYGVTSDFKLVELYDVQF